jgi:hypothetical protein
MKKAFVIQKVVDGVRAKTYLEIGVQTGKIISAIKGPTKIGVDPKFIYSPKVRLKKMIGLTRFKAIEKTSDYFFENYADKLLPNGIDVAFVDGLHKYEQALKDVENCLKYLNDDGVIILHDCNPLNYAGAYRIEKSFQEVVEAAENGDLPGWNGCWNGDTWKALVHLRITRDDLNIFTLDLHWGMGIITKGNGTKLGNITLEELQKAEYAFLETNREKLLNLKTPKYFLKYFADFSK